MFEAGDTVNCNNIVPCIKGFIHEYNNGLVILKDCTGKFITIDYAKHCHISRMVLCEKNIETIFNV